MVHIALSRPRSDFRLGHVFAGRGAKAVAEEPEMTAQDAVIRAFPRGSFSV